MLLSAIPAEAAFSDIPEGAWYSADVESAVESGIINGRSNDRFAPEEYLTAAEGIKLAACLSQMSSDGKVTLTAGDPWYKPYVEYMEKLGVKADISDWNAPAEREMFMYFFAHAMPEEKLAKVNEVEDGAVPDVAKENEYYSEIYTLYRAGIVRGSDESGKCNPKSPIKRSEAAAIITRMMNEEERLRFTMQKPAGVVASGTNNPDDGYYYNVNYSWVLTDDGTLTISGTSMTRYGQVIDKDGKDIKKEALPWSEYKDQIKKVVIEEGIKNIDYRAFEDYQNLEEVVLPSTLMYINDLAFADSSIKEISLPDGIREIGSSAFLECRSLEYINFPESLSEISSGAFTNSGLKEITLYGTTRFYIGAFEGCKNLEKVTFKDGVEIITQLSFCDCEKLKSVVIPASVKKINAAAFANTNIDSIYFEGDKPEISDTAFRVSKDDKTNSCQPTLYYLEGKSGWDGDFVTEDGFVYKTAVWKK